MENNIVREEQASLNQQDLEKADNNQATLEIAETEQNCSLPSKFKSVESLVKAYEAIEAEFTRKCQKVKALEDQLEANKNSAKASTDAPEKLENVGKQPNTEQQVSLPQENIQNNQEFVNQILQNADVREQIIKDYLKSVSASGVPNFINSSNATFNLAPTNKPTTLKDINQAVIAFFENK